MKKATKAPVKVPKKKKSSKRWTIVEGSGAGIVVDGVPVITDVKKAVAGLSKDDVIGIDLETTGLSAWRDNIALVQMYGEQSKTLAILQIRNGKVPEEVKDLFKRKDRTMVVHNGVGFDMWFMHTHGIDWQNVKWFDTLVGETVLASSGRRDVSKSLRASVKRRLGKTIDKDIEHGHWDNDVLSDRQIEYAAQDVLSLPNLYREHLEKAKSTEEDRALAMEMELAPLVAKMSINGLPCLRPRMDAYVEKQRKLAVEYEKFLYKKLGKINLGSHSQLKTALNNVGIAVDSTGKEVLEPLLMIDGPHHEIVYKLLEWKHSARRLAMYNPRWLDDNIIDGWVHPHFWQCSADTTRFTSSSPNLQQVPKDSRGDIIGGLKGYKIVSVDYSQIEVRIAAYIAQDAVLIEALEGEDIHRAVAAQVYGIKESEVTPHQRKIAKAMTFLLLFGGGVPRFYEYVRMAGGAITYEEASQLVYMFFKRFAGLKAMKDRAKRTAERPGATVIRLPNGNRRVLFGNTKRTTVILNTMVQGSAAVGLKYGMLEANHRGLFDYIGAQVHDELVAAVPDKKNLVKEFSNELAEAMIVGMRKAVDTTVKAGITIGDVWQA